MEHAAQHLRSLQSLFQDVITPAAMEYVTRLTIHAASGERLRKLRESAGLLQVELAALVGITHSAVSQMESGKLTPSWETALALYGECHSRIAKIPGRQWFLTVNDLDFYGKALQRRVAAGSGSPKGEALRALG